jgi:hypothetical protein
MEVDLALQRGIPVIPVLLGGARMSSEKELPPSLGNLSFRNALPLDSGQVFDLHVGRLVLALESLKSGKTTGRSPAGGGTGDRNRTRRRLRLIGAVATGVVLILAMSAALLK